MAVFIRFYDYIIHEWIWDEVTRNWHFAGNHVTMNCYSILANDDKFSKQQRHEIMVYFLAYVESV